MKENKYDNELFFRKYSEMNRSKEGLLGAGEWHILKKMLPSFQDKNVLDLGCGYGWHCKYAAERGARSILGVDISQKMLDKAKEINNGEQIRYEVMAVEDLDYQQQFDIVLSSLTFHYIASFEMVCKKVHRALTQGGHFIFSVEHPVFTAQGPQNWHYNEQGEIMHWPVDHYFSEGERNARFLGEPVIKYHKTLTTYLNGLLQNGFTLLEINEPMPSQEMLASVEGMKDELRRPMMLIVKAQKQ